MRELGQIPVQYVHIGLDSDYVDKLRKIVRKGNLYFTTIDEDNSYIKAIYEAEEVKASYWVHIESQVLLGTTATEITYVSFATHGAEISRSTQTKCMIIADRLKGMSQSFGDK